MVAASARAADSGSISANPGDARNVSVTAAWLSRQRSSDARAASTSAAVVKPSASIRSTVHRKSRAGAASAPATSTSRLSGESCV